VPNNDLLTAQQYNTMFTMHGTTMIFLAVMPLSAAFFNYIMPLQIGARDVAFPRLNAFSLWTFVAGAIILNIGWFMRNSIYGAPDAGWFGYAPLTSKTYSPDHSIDYWVMGLQLLGVASIAASLNFIVTIINLRAPA
jgi:cytochrome c oxidase subunit 1